MSSRNKFYAYGPEWRLKVLSWEQAGRLRESLEVDWQANRLVLCLGVFDLMHIGHLRHLQEAKDQGNILVVCLTPDCFVNKGPGRPVFNEALRLEMVASLEIVNYVVLNQHPTAREAICHLRPDVYCKGGEYQDPRNDITGQIVSEREAVESLGGRIHFTSDLIVYSSSALINRHLSSQPEPVREYLEELRRRYKASDLLCCLDSCAALKVLLVGDSILDEYVYVEPLGKSPKDNIITTRYQEHEIFAGGTLAIANHLAGFVGQVDLVSAWGLDKDLYIRGRLAPNVKLKYHVNRPTIIKRRFVEKAFFAKLFEVASLQDRPDEATEAEMYEALRPLLGDYDLVVVADFGHGLLSSPDGVFNGSRFLALMTQVNSANFGFNLATKYGLASYLCLDETEARLAVGDRYGEIEEIASSLQRELYPQVMAITLGHRGCLVVSQGVTSCQSPALSGQIVDRTGAGDAFFALSALSAYKGLEPGLIALVGNAAAALKTGTVCNQKAVGKVALYKYLSALLR